MALNDYVGAAQRARDARMAADPTHPFGQGGVLSNPQWDAWFQTLQDNGVSGLADSSVGEAKGMWTPANRNPITSTIWDPSVQQSSIGQSNQIGVPGVNALQGLFKATGGTYNPRSRRK